MAEENYAIVKNGVVIQTEILNDPTVEYQNELLSRYDADEIVLGNTVNAQVGSLWDGAIFTRPKPYPSWILDEFLQWVAPVPYPSPDVISDIETEEGKWWLEDPNKYDEPVNETVYEWDETVINWVPKA